MKTQFITILYLIIIIKKSHTESDDDSGNNSDDFTGQNYDSTTDSIENVIDDDIIKKILDSSTYSILVRPSGSVNISLKLSLRQLVTVDVQNQIITTNIYLATYWMDARLKWDASTAGFENLTTIIVPANKIWTPDFSIMNSATGNGFVAITSSNLAIVNNLGIVYLILNIAGLQTRCKMNVMNYPFDTQNCSITVGSWQHDTTRINFLSDENKIDLSNYMSHPVWSLNRVQVMSQLTDNRYLKSTKYKNEDIYFYLIIKRGALYIMINNVYPCLILNGVTLLSYFVPFASQITLTMTTFITYGVYAIRTSTDLPIQSEYFPLISIYFSLSIIYTFLSMIWFLTAKNFADKSLIPNYLQMIVNVTKFVMFFGFKTKHNKQAPVNEPKNETSNAVEEMGFHHKKKCLKCETCDVCEHNKAEESLNKSKKEQFESNLLALNYFFLFLMFLLIFISNMIIWIRIIYYN